MKSIKFFQIVLSFLFIALFISGCNKENSTEPTELTDEQFIKQVITNGYSNSENDEDNLIFAESQDLDDGGAVNDDDNGPMNPIDSLKKWGRKVTNKEKTIQISGNDTMKYVSVTHTISGNYIILGYVNGQLDTIIKPYTSVFYRNIVFKRVARTPYPRLNWRVYQISNSDGQTTLPQIGSSQVQITKVEIYKNNSPTPTYVITGPDFQNYYYTTILFSGSGIPSLNRGEQILIKVYTISQQTPVDYVAFHWAKNTFGFHRIPFALESQIGNERIYKKTFNVYSQHKIGVFNGFIGASTHESLYDDDINKFASDQVGIPYKVLQ